MENAKHNSHQQEEEEVMVSIKDTGTGIDSEILPRLFTKFATKSDMAGGTGLGLFISKSIIESHGGKMWAHNNNNNINNGQERGATFYFILQLMTNNYCYTVILSSLPLLFLNVCYDYHYCFLA